MKTKTKLLMSLTAKVQYQVELDPLNRLKKYPEILQ